MLVVHDNEEVQMISFITWSRAQDFSLLRNRTIHGRHIAQEYSAYKLIYWWLKKKDISYTTGMVQYLRDQFRTLFVGAWTNRPTAIARIAGGGGITGRNGIKKMSIDNIGQSANDLGTEQLILKILHIITWIFTGLELDNLLRAVWSQSYLSKWFITTMVHIMVGWIFFWYRRNKATTKCTRNLREIDQHCCIFNSVPRNSFACSQTSFQFCDITSLLLVA